MGTPPTTSLPLAIYKFHRPLACTRVALSDLVIFEPALPIATGSQAIQTVTSTTCGLTQLERIRSRHESVRREHESAAVLSTLVGQPSPTAGFRSSDD